MASAVSLQELPRACRQYADRDADCASAPRTRCPITHARRSRRQSFGLQNASSFPGSRPTTDRNRCPTGSGTPCARWRALRDRSEPAALEGSLKRMKGHPLSTIPLKRRRLSSDGCAEKPSWRQRQCCRRMNPPASWRARWDRHSPSIIARDRARHLRRDLGAGAPSAFWSASHCQKSSRPATSCGGCRKSASRLSPRRADDCLRAARAVDNRRSTRSTPRLFIEQVLVNACPCLRRRQRHRPRPSPASPPEPRDYLVARAHSRSLPTTQTRKTPPDFIESLHRSDPR